MCSFSKIFYLWEQKDLHLTSRFEIIKKWIFKEDLESLSLQRRSEQKIKPLLSLWCQTSFCVVLDSEVYCMFFVKLRSRSRSQVRSRSGPRSGPKGPRTKDQRPGPGLSLNLVCHSPPTHPPVNFSWEIITPCPIDLSIQDDIQDEIQDDIQDYTQDDI